MPRLWTHKLVSMALVSVIFGLIFPRSLITLFGALVAAWICDWTIDRFGHRTVHMNNGYSRSLRTPLTHSVLTAPIIGLGVGLLTAYLLIAVKVFLGGLVSGDLYDVFVTSLGEGAWFLNFQNFNVVMSLTGTMTGLLHLFLDSFTQSGILAPFKRWRIAGVSARDAGLNVTLKLAAILTMAYVLGVRIPFVGALFPIPLFTLPVLALGLVAGTAVTIIRHRGISSSQLVSSSDFSRQQQTFSQDQQGSFKVPRSVQAISASTVTVHFSPIQTANCIQCGAAIYPNERVCLECGAYQGSNFRTCSSHR